MISHEVGLLENCKTVFLFDKCSAYPDEEQLVSSNVFATYLPPNYYLTYSTHGLGIIQPMK